mgnify:CR=1 FL=1
MDDKLEQSLDARMRKGIEANRFLQYMDEGEKYFKGIFEEIDEELCREINGLDPKQQMEFTILQAKRLALYEPIRRVTMDQAIGIDARDKLSGKNQHGGLL